MNDVALSEDVLSIAAHLAKQGKNWPDWAVYCMLTLSAGNKTDPIQSAVHFYPSKIAMLRAVVKTRRWVRADPIRREAVVSYYEWDWGPTYRGEINI